MAEPSNPTATSPSEAALRRRIRNMIIFFMVMISLSGITAFPVETELRWLNGWLHAGRLSQFLAYIETAMTETNRNYPQMAYGFDWLAFAHLVIAMMFIGPL